MFTHGIYRPLRFWCQKVLPLVYDDSLSYYEVLCKLTKYINDLIASDVEIVKEIENIKDYINTQLENYTNEELQKWIDDGTLENLILEVIKKISNTLDESYDSVVSNDIENYGYDELMREIALFKTKYGEMCSFTSLGTSYLGRDIPLIIMGNPNGRNKCLVVGNAHAREIHTAQFLMKEIEFICENWENYYDNEAVKDMFANTVYYIVPNQNPDGVELVINGIASIPTSTPNYNSLVNNVKAAIEYKVQNHISRGDVDRQWDLYGNIVWTDDVGKIANYQFRDQDCFLWKSNLEGIDLHYNGWTEATNYDQYLNAQGQLIGTYTQGLFRAENDIGLVGFGAVENSALLTLIQQKGLRSNCITMHGRTPYFIWNYSLTNNVYNRAKAVVEDLGKVCSERNRDAVSKQVGLIGYYYAFARKNLSHNEYLWTNAMVDEIGWSNFPINPDNGNILPSSPIVSSPLKNEQEPYIWDYNKYLLVRYLYYVRRKDLYKRYDEISLGSMAWRDTTCVIRGVDADGNPLEDAYGGEYSIKECRWRFEGDLCHIIGQINMTNDGTLDTAEGVAGIAIDLPNLPCTMADYGIQYADSTLGLVSGLDMGSDPVYTQLVGRVMRNKNLIHLYAQDLRGARRRVTVSSITVPLILIFDVTFPASHYDWYNE